ncbi:MAG: hypothetical protein IJV66_05070 [Firmicutes bacterium]|nr:hypothetical protein [Bacillota bacterium]
MCLQQRNRRAEATREDAKKLSFREERGSAERSLRGGAGRDENTKSSEVPAALGSAGGRSGTES